MLCSTHVLLLFYVVVQGIPTLLMAAGSFDDILAITGFSTCLGIVFSKGRYVNISVLFYVVPFTLVVLQVPRGWTYWRVYWRWWEGLLPDWSWVCSYAASPVKTRWEFDVKLVLILVLKCKTELDENPVLACRRTWCWEGPSCCWVSPYFQSSLLM